VVVPRANLRDLMLEQALVSAAAQGLFHVHAVAGIDELMTLLTGLPAGARNAAGRYPPGSVNARVEARLLQLAERSRHEATPPRPARRRA
jgi:predicted ATP-dependent protease